MEFIADVLLISGAAGAAFYCIVLSRRLKRFNDLEKGVGGAIAVLSTQVDDMTKTLDLAQNAANGSNESLEDLTTRAEDVAKRLEILVASMHDLPAAEEVKTEAPQFMRSETRGSAQEPEAINTEGSSESAFRSARASTESIAA